MSFWDSIKPTTRPPTASAVDISKDGQVLSLTWDDQVQTKVTARALRQSCPCAECVDEWTRKRTFDQESVSREMKVTAMHAVGNYALAFTFADGHGTGIFNWGFLREISERPPAR